jgi:predicted dehydrogenase
MVDDLRVGIIGYGIGGQVFHAPLIEATTGMTPAVLVTANPDRSARAREDFPQAAVVSDVDRLFERADELDLIVVTTPNRTHVPLALRSIELGVPVVVDKPFAPTAAEAMTVVSAAESAGVGLTVFQNRRWDSDFLTVRRILDSGRLGQVHRFESRYDRWRPTPGEGWRELGNPGEAGGLLYDLGAHIVDQALQLFGPVTDVYAEVERRRPRAKVDDDVFVALHHANGVRSHLWASMLAATLGPRFRVLGDRAAFTKYGLDVQEPQVREGMRPGDDGWGVEPASDAGILGAEEQQEAVPTEAGRYQDFYAQVRDALRGNARYPVDPRDAVTALRVIEAAQKSAAERRVISVAVA